jgi:cold shock protein
MRMTGTIKKIITDKGFGFITPDEGKDEVFFHRSKLASQLYFEDLREGDEVEFLIRPGEKDRKPSTSDLARASFVFWSAVCSRRLREGIQLG